MPRQRGLEFGGSVRFSACGLLCKVVRDPKRGCLTWRSATWYSRRCFEMAGRGKTGMHAVRSSLRALHVPSATRPMARPGL